MVDITAIASAVSSLKTASDIAKGLIGLRDGTIIQEKVIELQSIILSAQSDALATQSEQFSLLNRIRQLEEEVTKIKAWEAEKQRYELYQPVPGMFVYALKKGEAMGEPPHWICVNCIGDGHKSILQKKAETNWENRWEYRFDCPKCKHEMWMQHKGAA